MAEKHARILGELAEFGLDLARKLHDQGMAAETPAETAELARAFHSVARSVRQTLALEVRLAREAARQGSEDRAEADRLERDAQRAAQARAEAPTKDRKTRISTMIERIVAEKYDEEEAEAEAERLMDEIYERLAVDAEAANFLDHPIDDQIARLCAEFGLPAPVRPIASRPVAPAAPLSSSPSALAYAGDWADPP